MTLKLRNPSLYELLNQLEPIPDEGAERDAVLTWRAFVALLTGHIDLYRFQAPDQAARHYQLVLASHPQDTLREPAAQGLERIRSGRESVTRSMQTTDPVRIDSWSLLQPRAPLP